MSADRPRGRPGAGWPVRSTAGSLATAGAARAETASLFAPPIGWPLLPVPSTDGRLAWPDLATSVRDAIRIVLATQPGELLQHPSFGVGLERDLQRPNQIGTRADIVRRITEGLARHEPRIALDLVDVRPEDGGRRLRVEIRYRITATGAAQRLSVAAVVADAAPA